MELVKSTAKIVAYKVLNRDVGKAWIDWAVAMLMAGFDTESLGILAGESEPYNQFQLQQLTSKTLDELCISFSDAELAIKNYACYLINESLTGATNIREALKALNDLCDELDNVGYLYDFRLLYWALEDLDWTENQWYWEGVTRENIDETVRNYFAQWKTNWELKGRNDL